KQAPTVMILAPLIFVRDGGSFAPSAELASTGYGTGTGLGAAGVVHTLTAHGVIWWPDRSVMQSIMTAVTLIVDPPVSSARAHTDRRRRCQRRRAPWARVRARA